MRMKHKALSGALLALALAAGLASPAFAQASAVDFGDDTSEWAKDGECDDPRFDGPGMTQTTLLSDDILADASDCGEAYSAGRLTLKGVAEDGTIDFGDDSGEYSKDGECDDLRFKGSGMTVTALLEDDIMHDATDCEADFKAGKLKLRLN